jgi:nucleoside-diphosphate-sugar epimerase
VDPAFHYRWATPGENVDIEITSEGERGALEISRVITEFGFAPKYDLRRGLENYLEWAREYPGLFPAAI